MPSNTIERPRADVLRARRTEILRQWGLDDRGFTPILERRDLRGDEWQAENELDGIEFVLGDDL